MEVPEVEVALYKPDHFRNSTFDSAATMSQEPFPPFQWLNATTLRALALAVGATAAVAVVGHLRTTATTTAILWVLVAPNAEVA